MQSVSAISRLSLCVINTRTHMSWIKNTCLTAVCLCQGDVSAANPMINLITLIQPHLGPSLVSEFGCTYKFVVANETGTFDVYHLDVKHG